jgi:uncharacterized protein (DUF433 family)
MEQRMADTRLERITIDPDVMVGKPVVRGTRVPVEVVLKHLAETLDVAAVLEAFPRLTEEDIKACVDYARRSLEGEAVYPATAPRGRSRAG